MESILSTLRKLAKRLFRRREDARLKAMADVLCRVPLFAPLSRGMLMELAESIHERTYRRDEFLYYQGDPGIGLYVIRSGNVRLLVDGDTASKEIGTVAEGDVLGATCLLGGGVIRRAESAQATADTDVLGLFSPEFRTFQRRHPKTGVAVATLLARYFAQMISASRAAMTERDGEESAAVAEMEAWATAALRADPPPGW